MEREQEHAVDLLNEPAMQTLLLVHHDQAQSARHGDKLRADGFIVYEFSDGKAALEFVKENSVDVILCEHSESELDGLEFLRDVKEAGQRTLVILSSLPLIPPRRWKQ